LRCIEIPPAIIAIKAYKFYDCSELTTVILDNGLKEIEAHAFAGCRSLERIKISPTVRVIKGSGMTTVILNDGLEEIGKHAFYDCRSLERIKIPPATRVIKGLCIL
jgi:hypothetical protein